MSSLYNGYFFKKNKRESSINKEIAATISK